MDLRRLRTGEISMAVAGFLLLVALFLPWYDPVLGDGISAWKAFSITDIILALLALASLAAVPVVARGVTASPGVAYEALVLLFSLPCLVICLFRLLDPPAEGLDRGVGAYLGLVSVVGIGVACLVAMRDERLSTPGRLTDSTGVPVSEAAEIETLPAPRP